MISDHMNSSLNLILSYKIRNISKYITNVTVGGKTNIRKQKNRMFIQRNNLK